MIGRLALVLLVAVLGWCYQAIQPPPPKICGSPNGPPVVSKRIRLSDGRHLAYKETGVPKDKATYKIVIAHGWTGSKEHIIPASNELVEELGVYFVSFDRAGYGESDPYPGRSVKSEAYDIEQLADGLELGDRFYVIGVIMGGYPVYACLKYIPHRLVGAGLIVPVINYWWPSLPSNLSREALGRQRVSDRRMFSIAHYAPSLLNWWMTQKWFVSSDTLAGHPDIYCPHDREIHERMNK
ncbi:hypothetical protein H6P81_003514 [Aristolochia fimbriata]|uniref:Serine aminopeptidase S33 domain-containing protein n=1 Tax=Aristolochia fimbriata TaxID=158543 RepID=A0AAV7FDV1_ARIFI|nr:hypothetical protein H6P81_003514 [Aristolochia fimbriata]